MEVYMKRLLPYCLGLLSSLSLFADTIIFDLGGTLIEPNTTYLASKMGVAEYSMYSFFDGKSHEDLLFHVFDILSLIEGDQIGEVQVLTDKGIPFPQVLVSWHEGKVTSQDILDEAYQILDELCEMHFISKGREYNLVKNALNIMLDPEILAHSMTPIKKGRKLLKKIANACDAEGNSCHQLYILSNWDKQSFQNLTDRKDIKDLFDYFPAENITTSADLAGTKPHASTFKKFLEKHDLKAEDCVFIDDQLENLAGAKACGIRTVRFDVDHIKNTYKELEALGLHLAR
jgi:FMN phosphatase YigB (HAD superfamily)